MPAISRFSRSVNVRLPQETYDFFMELSEKRSIALSAAVRLFIEDNFAKRGRFGLNIDYDENKPKKPKKAIKRPA